MSVEKFELQGKYQVELVDGYKMTINRNNEPWMSSGELAGNNIMLALIQEVLDLKESKKELAKGVAGHIINEMYGGGELDFMSDHQVLHEMLAEVIRG